MRNVFVRFLGLTCLAALLLYGTAGAQDLLKNRARWEWSLPDSKEKGSTFTGWVTGTLTTGKGKTEKDRTKIGKWTSPAPNEIQLVIDKGPLTGTSRVKMTKTDPVTFEGELERKGGKKEKVVYKLFKD